MTKFAQSNEFLQSVERFQAVMGTVDELTHVVLKGHLLIEEALDAVIALHLFHPEHFFDARLTFDKKISIARAFNLRKHQLGEWDMLKAVNELRNNLAHNLDSPKQKSKLQRVRELAIKESAGLAGAEGLVTADDKIVVVYACGHLLGFLQMYAADAKGLRTLLHRIDRDMNPGEPPFDLEMRRAD